MKTAFSFPPLLDFCAFSYILVFILPVYTCSSGARSAGLVEAGSGDVRCASQSEVDVEGGKSGNDTGKELDRNSELSFGMSLYRTPGNVV